MTKRILYLVSKRGTFDGTGIDRVTRALHNAIADNLPPSCEIWPVYIDGAGVMHRSDRLSSSDKAHEGEFVAAVAGDIIFSADLVYDLSEEAKASLVALRDRGISLYFVLYDLIPIRRPDWFSGESVHKERVTYLPTFEKWVHFVFSQATGLLCISKTVEDDARLYATSEFKQASPTLKLEHFHLGFDLEASLGSTGLDKSARAELNKIVSRKTFLMVGTLEPRKSHRLALDAFEMLWDEGLAVNLVVLGRAGKPWMSNYASELVDRFESHAELHERLFWLDGVSDAYLRTLYDKSTALLMISESEGFGLPLVEAANAHLSIIARDLPIFRELCGAHAYYFQGTTAVDLAATLRTWLGLHKSMEHPRSDGMKTSSWKDSAGQVLQAIERMQGEQIG